MLVSLNIVHVVMFAFLSLLCGAVFIGLRRQSSLAWLALALLCGAVDVAVLGLGIEPHVKLVAVTILVPSAYLSLGQAVRHLTGYMARHRPLLIAVALLAALSISMLWAGVPFVVQTVPFQLACALALGDCAYRLAGSGPGLMDLLIIAVLGCVASIFLIRIPLYPLVFGLAATPAEIGASALEKTLLTASALLSPPAVFLLLARIVGNVISTYRNRAERDGLTGLYNRGALDEMAGQADPAGGTVIFCDIDHFKAINDRYGHQAGDRVIAAFAKLIEHTGYRAARIGGEEFVVLMPGKSAAEGAELAEMIRRRFHDATHPGIERADSPTASFGVAAYPAGAPPVAAFVKADGALYGAKGAGRNCVVALAADDRPVMLEAAA